MTDTPDRMHEPQEMSYRCPHCDAVVGISEELAGERVDCPRCEKPFEVGVPVAQPERGDASASEYHMGAGSGDTEEILRVAHPSPFRNRPLGTLGALLVVALGVLLLVAAAAGGLGLGLFDAVSGVATGTTLAIAAGVVALVGLIPLLYWYLRSRFTTLTVTSERTILREGIVSRDTSEVRHADVRNIQVDQGFFQRLLGVGELAISSSGQDELELVLHGAPDPEGIAAIVRDLQ